MKKLFPFLCLGFIWVNANSQAQLVIGNTSAAYVVLANGTGSTPIYLVVANPATTGIVRNFGGIISEGEYNLVQWNINVTTGAHVFPFATASKYLPVTFNNTGNAGNVTASTRATGTLNTPLPSGVTSMQPSGASDDNGNRAIDRWWHFNSSAGPTLPAVSLTFTYVGDENTITGGSGNELGIQHWNGTYWNNGQGGSDGSYISTSTNGVTTPGSTNTIGPIAGFTEFSPYVLVRTAFPLPIELLSFSGKCRDEKVELSWETATETNNQSFSIERTDGSQGNDVWTSLGTVPGAGNSSSILDYSFTDSQISNLKSQIYYYRLKQTDFDGSCTYSGVIAISDCYDKNNDNISIFIGNNNEIIFSMNAASPKRYDVFFYDNLGRRIHSEVLNVTEGTNVKILNPGKFATGTYFITLQNDEDVIAKKIFLH